jgi:hypothetical protein
MNWILRGFAAVFRGFAAVGEVLTFRWLFRRLAKVPVTPAAAAARRAEKEAERERKKRIADAQAKIASGRYEAVSIWRKVMRPRSAEPAVDVEARRRRGLPWTWERAGVVLRAVNKKKRRGRLVAAAYGVDWASGRQRRIFRKRFNRAYRAGLITSRAPIIRAAATA